MTVHCMNFVKHVEQYTETERPIKAAKVTLFCLGRLIAQVVSRWLPTRGTRFGFVVDKVALGQVFSEYFGFPYLSSFHQLLHNHHLLSPGSGIIGQSVAAVPSALCLTPLRITIIKKTLYCDLERSILRLCHMNMKLIIINFNRKQLQRCFVVRRTRVYCAGVDAEDDWCL
jgi:hypothetical protein